MSLLKIEETHNFPPARMSLCDKLKVRDGSIADHLYRSKERLERLEKVGLDVVMKAEQMFLYTAYNVEAKLVFFLPSGKYIFIAGSSNNSILWKRQYC